MEKLGVITRQKEPTPWVNSMVTVVKPNGDIRIYIYGMHLKEVSCLKCSVIIGRKVGLDYNSWYACLTLIRHVGRSSFANFDSRS